MPDITVYYDHFEDRLAPVWMLVRLTKGFLNGKEKYLPISIETPFNRHLAEDFHSDLMSMSLQMEDLTLHPEHPGEFRIYLPSLNERIQNEKRRAFEDFNEHDIEQLIIQMADIEEVLQTDIRQHYDWR